MLKNNKLLETLARCVHDNKRLGNCRGCYYGDGTTDITEAKPQCMLNLMNDVLFFFGNPYPDPEARILSLHEVEEAIADKKDHLAFCEFISSIHIAKPCIRIVKSSGNFISLFDPQTNENDSFNKSEYYTSFRIWSTKPTDKLRNDTPWEVLESMASDNSANIQSKTEAILSFISKMT